MRITDGERPVDEGDAHVAVGKGLVPGAGVVVLELKIARSQCVFAVGIRDGVTVSVLDHVWLNPVTARPAGLDGPCAWRERK